MTNRVKAAEASLELIRKQRDDGVALARRIGKPASFHHKRAEDKTQHLVTCLAGEVQYLLNTCDILTNRDRELVAERDQLQQIIDEIVGSIEGASQFGDEVDPVDILNIISPEEDK